MILDVVLPDLDGFEVCRRIRARSDAPVLMLTARGDETDRVVALELGADDYLPKPFGPRELLARLRAILRRRGGAPPRQPRECSGFGLGLALVWRIARLHDGEARCLERPGGGTRLESRSTARQLAALDCGGYAAAP